MFTKFQTNFDGFSVEDFGLKKSDQDTHKPSFYIMRKSHTWSHKDRHQRSAEGRKRDAERRKQKLQWKKKQRYVAQEEEQEAEE